MPMQSDIPSDLPNNSYPNSLEVTLKACETQRLVRICIELIDLCSKVTAKFDPAMGTMIAYARDEALESALRAEGSK